MTMDVSRLGIVVESNGIAEARKALDGGNGRGGLVGAADKAERSVTKLTDSVGRLITLNTGGFATAWNQSIQQLVTTLSAMNLSVKEAISNLTAMAPALDKAAQATQRAANASERKAYHGGVVINTLKAMTTAAVAYSAVNLGLSIVKQADAWQMMTARLTNATGSLKNAKVAQEQMYDLSQRLRVPLEDSVKLYNRLAPAVQRMGKDSGYAKDMVEGIATALQLGGANGAEASSVMLQLSQSFSSGVLNGAEFNAVAENGSVLMRALEKETGKSTSELKKLGSEGKLSMSLVGKAIQDNLPLWREQFDKLPLTFEGAVQRLKNAWTKAVGEMGQDTGFNQELSKSLRVIENMIPAIAQGLGNAFISVMKWVEENREKLSQIWDQLVGIGKDVWRVAGAFGEWMGAILGAGESVSLVGSALFGVRMIVAAIVDIVKVLGSAFVHVGLDVAQVLLLPVQLALAAVSQLTGAYGKLFELAATGARVAGADALADKLEFAAEKVKNFSDGAADVNTKIDAFIQKGRDMANGWTEELRAGRGELDNLLNGVNDFNVKVKKMEPVKVMNEKEWGANPNPKTPVDSKAVTAAKTELKRYNDILSDINSKMREQQQLQAAIARDGLGYDKIGPAQKRVYDLEEDLVKMRKLGATTVAIANQEALIQSAKLVASLEAENEKTLALLRTQQSYIDQERTATKSAQTAAMEAEKKLATYGMEKGAIEALTLAEAQRAVVAFNTLNSGRELTLQEQQMLALMQEKVMWLEKLQTANAAIGAKDAEKEFEKLFDASKAEKFGNALADGFSKGAEAVGKLMNAFDKYEARQSKIKKGWELVNKETDPTKRSKMTEQLIERETQSRLTSYADMAGAAKGFFEEGTRGYKAMEYAEKTFRLFQMAMNMKAFLQEIGLLEASTTAQVVANSQKAASDIQAAGVSVAASQAEGTASAAAAVANQGKGDPYTAFGRMAAMAAIMAAIGFAVGGIGGGGDVAKQRQATQGTGTVMGDAAAKSESISKSIALLAKNSDIALRYSSGMLNSLQNIEVSLTGATSGVIRSGGVTGKDFQNTKTGASALQSAVFGGVIGILDHYLLGGTISKLLGFGTSTSLQDSGLVASSQSVGNILSSGFNVKGYQDVETKKKAFGITYSRDSSTNYSDVDPAVSREFGNVVSGMVDSLVYASEALGYSGEEVRRKLEAANIDIGKISLKGLSGEEIQKQLEAVFSAIGDNLTTLALPSVVVFQRAGEGLLETAVRVASGVESAGYELEKLGLTAVAVGAIINTSGNVGAEIVRQSIMLREAGTGVGEIINTLGGEAGDIAATYKDLLAARNSLTALGIADDVTRDLIRAAGGLDALQSALDAYTSNFFSTDEQNAMKASALRKEFDKLGVVMPANKDAFRALVDNLSAAGASGQATAMKVLLLSEAFAEVSDAFDTRVSDARTALAEAYDRESSALEDTKSRFEDFTASLLEFRSSLLTGDLSTLDVASKYTVEKAKFEETLAKAKAGDEAAIGSFSEVANSFLTASRAMNASGSTYTADFDRVLAETDALAAITSDKTTFAEKQLEALNQQVSGLMTVNESVLTVTEAIDALNALLAGGFVTSTGADGRSTIMPVVDGSHKMGLESVPFDGYIAELHKGERVLTAEESKAYQVDYSQYGNAATVSLVEEIKALRSEVKTLRDGQREQTGQLIAANYDAQERNAQTIVEGSKDAAMITAYSERAKVTLS